MFLSALAAMGNLARGADFFVAPGGLDTNPGSMAQPWGTIQKAANSLTPGDRVLVRAGVYAERVTVNVSGSAAGGSVRFENFPGERPILDATGVTPPASVDTALFLLTNRSDVVISGFELRNFKSTATTRTPAGVLLRGVCANVEIRNCDIHDIWNTAGNTTLAGNAFGIAIYGSSATPATGIVIDGNELHALKTGSSECLVLNGNVTNFQVTNNFVHDNNNIGIDFIGFEGTCPDAAQDQARDGVCRGNTVWNISSQGNQAYASGDFSAGAIYCDGATRVIIERNVARDSDIGVELASEHSGKVTSAIMLRDNFIHGNRQTGLFLGGYASTGTGGTDGCTITNNTFFQNDTLGWSNGEAQLRFRTSNCTFRNNVFSAGAQALLVTMPVSAANNVGNRFDYDLYFAAAGSTAAQWSWNNTTRTGFAAWKSASAQDSHSLFADPKFVSTSTATLNLHLRLDSPAIDAGEPGFVAASGETDGDAALRVTGPRVDVGADELSAFDAWRVARFGTNAVNDSLAGPAADPDHDGSVNLTEYVIGTDPAAPVAPAAPTVAGSRLTLTFTRNTAATDATLIVRGADDLAGPWTDLARSVNGVPVSPLASGVAVTESGTGTTRTVEVRDLFLTSDPAHPRRFLRLQISRTGN